MLGLPKSTEMSKQLPKKAVYAKFQMNTAAKEKIDADISRITIVNEITPAKINIPAGEEVGSFFVLLVALKKKDFDERTVATLSKLIPQNILFVLEFEGQSKLAIYHTKLMQTDWKPTESCSIELRGLNLDKVWENIVVDIGGVSIADGNTLNEQIAADERRQKIEKEIAKLEKEVAEWKEKSIGAEVTAKTAGTVSTVSAVAGREVAAGTALAAIEVVDRGYTLKFSVTKEQAQKVRLGDKAEISNYWWGSGIDATLTQIMPDSANPSTNKLLVFTLTGDVSSGDNLSLSIGEQSANYDSVIPSSAVRSDSNGTFVLVLTAKSTPLGNRYTATRVDVKVLAQDDTKSAVSGLSYGDFVITTSSKPLDAGMQVRMVDNAT